MSPWDVIGWTIAIPMVLMTVVFVFAIPGAIWKALSRRSKSVRNHPAGKPKLRLVEDD
jgi:hypothetical protein